SLEPGARLLESVGNVLEEDQPEDDVLVLRRVHRAAERVGHLPELGLVAQRRRRGRSLGGSACPPGQRHLAAETGFSCRIEQQRLGWTGGENGRRWPREQLAVGPSAGSLHICPCGSGSRFSIPRAATFRNSPGSAGFRIGGLGRS